MARALRRARSGRRLALLLVLYLVLTAAVGARLLRVQVLDAADFAELADRQTQRQIDLPATRGKLYDRDGQPLALSLAAATVYADPRVLRENDVDPRGVAAELAPLLDRPVEAVTDALSRDVSFTYLARQLPREVGEQVAALRLPGVGILTEPTRSYPAGGLAAQLVGFAGVDNVGLSGLEAQYDDVLAGRPGALRLERAPGGLVISAAPREVQPAVAGTDLVLTIDRQIQHTAERVLAEAVSEHDAKGAAAVVVDVPTGEVLAMASVPGFTPERIGQAGAYERSNRVVTDVYEPGSVSKIITAAAAVEEGVVRMDEVFSVPDHYQVGAKRFRDSSPHEPWALTLPQIIARSSNVGTIKLSERVGPERLYGYLRAFGYAEATGLGFPGEASGLLPRVEDWWATSLPTIAIGQGVSTTLLQVAGVLETIASGGERVQPSVVRGTVGADGRLRPSRAGERERIVSPQTAAALTGMLVGAVEGEHATGGLARIPGYRVAGKTGTAQKPSQTRRGYAEGKYVASFAGFAPADDPALVVAVLIDEPADVFSGGAVAAPAFSEITRFALAHRRVPASEPYPADDVVAVGPGRATGP
ncbi:MAG TPA: penicillin-binding protein 2 [Egibacteraceae bacterium]|nr:penicillin-binding protein 2 [Egibacteraceae bacterium]